MNAVRQLFAKKPAPPATVTAPRKRPAKRVTCAELNVAIAAVCDGMEHCTTRQTLEALWALTDSDDASPVRLDGAAPVTLAEFDNALSDIAQFGLAESTIAPLKRMRTLLAEAEAQKAKEPPQYVTVAQLKSHDVALFDALGWALGAMAEEFNRAQPSQSHVIDLLQRSATSPERKKLLSGIAFKQPAVRKRTQEEYLRYQATGHW